MNKNVRNLGLVAITIIAGVIIWLMTKKNPKKWVSVKINNLGGLAYYNYAAAQAKKKGFIEEDAKLSSMEEIKGLSKDKIKLVATVLGLIEACQVSIGPARDAHGNFIKTEKEGE